MRLDLISFFFFLPLDNRVFGRCVTKQPRFRLAGLALAFGCKRALVKMQISGSTVMVIRF